MCTHGHNDHVGAAPELAAAVAAPVLLHRDDRPLWQLTHDVPPDGELRDGDEIEVAGLTLEVLHTPGHTPGSVCLYAKDLATVFTGDTLFNGGPGATGRRFSDRGVLLMSITDRLLALPRQTIVKTGHGDDTTIADERAGILDAETDDRSSSVDERADTLFVCERGGRQQPSGATERERDTPRERRQGSAR